MSLKIPNFSPKIAVLSFFPAIALLGGNPEAKAFTPITVIDNIGSSAFPGTGTTRSINQVTWFATSFTTPSSGGPYFLSGLRLALSSLDATPTGVSRTMTIGLYGATNTGNPLVATTGGYKPTGNRLATQNYTASYNTSGNATQGGGFTILNPGLLGPLTSFQLAPNTSYSLVLSSSNASSIVMRSMVAGTPYTTSNQFTYLNNTGVANAPTGSSLDPITITPSTWLSASTANLATTALGIQVVPVPGPLPVLGAVAAFGFSRRLRRHINRQA
jgi:hypothetical protein